MDLNEFNDYYLDELLHKLSLENKSVILHGDFNVDLIKYNNHHSINEFLDSLSSHLFLPHITKPTRLRDSSETLVDNIFSNTSIKITISGNLTATVYDHLPQFIILPNISLIFLPINQILMKETDPILSKKTLYWTIFLSTGIL